MEIGFSTYDKEVSALAGTLSASTDGSPIDSAEVGQLGATPPSTWTDQGRGSLSIVFVYLETLPGDSERVGDM